jgi:MraZ protein
MLALFGEYEIAIDAKGRCLLPAVLRKQFPEGSGDRFMISRGFENCLNLFPMETWQVNYQKIAVLDDFDEDARTFKRLFLNGATPVEVDNADRILMPKLLQEYANIKKDAILVGLGDKMELWDKEAYQKFLSGNSANFSKLAKIVVAKKPDQPSNI